MNRDQQKIKKLLAKLIEGEDYEEFKPSTKKQIAVFLKRAEENGVPDEVVRQLVDLYELANRFFRENFLGFFACDDLTIFEWWDENDRTLWLGLFDYYVTRWTNGKFCLGDASSVSFSNEYEFDTLAEFFEGCLKELKKRREED